MTRLARLITRALGTVIAIASLSLAIASVVPSQASAANASCHAGNPTAWCAWSKNPLAPNFKLYFNDGSTSNLRTWTSFRIWDEHNGSIASKCVGVKRSNDGQQFPLACGSGTPSWQAEWIMGWAWIQHGAGSARNIVGYGTIW